MSAVVRPRNCLSIACSDTSARPHSRPVADSRDSLSRLSNWLIAAVKLVSKWLTRCVQSERDKSIDLALCDDASCQSVDGTRYLVLSRSCVRRTDSAPVVPFRRSRIVASVRRVIASVRRVIAPFVERCATNVDIPVAIPGGFRPCCVEHTCLVSQLLSGIAVRFRSSYRGGHARASQSRSIRVRQASRLHKDCITTSCCCNRFDVSCSVMFVVAIIFFLLGTTTIHEST